MFFAWVNKTFELGSKTLHLCGHGAENNWSVRIADWFFIDCACCLFWRGAVVGWSVGIVVGAAIAVSIIKVL